MAYDEKLLERVRKTLASQAGVSEINMFGGVCFSINGNMACGVQESELVVRVGPEQHDSALKEKHARPMDFTGRPMRGMVYVSQEGCKDSRSLKKWVGRGVRFAGNLPPKEKAKKKRARSLKDVRNRRR